MLRSVQSLPWLLAAFSHFLGRRSQQQQTPPSVDIGTVTRADGSGRIVKNVQSERNPDRINTFL
jgi:hypothetical protein